MTEEKEDKSAIASLGLLRKFHPVAVLLIFGFMFLLSQIWNSNLALEKKVVPLALSGVLYFIALSFEIRRVTKEKELREKRVF